MVKKKIEQEIYFTVYGHLTYLCLEYSMIKTGHYSARMRHQDSQVHGENNLINYTNNMNPNQKEENLLKPENYSMILSNHKLKLVHHIYYIRIQRIENLINNILVPSNALISVQKSSNTHPKMKSLHVI